MTSASYLRNAVEFTRIPIRSGRLWCIWCVIWTDGMVSEKTPGRESLMIRS